MDAEKYISIQELIDFIENKLPIPKAAYIRKRILEDEELTERYNLLKHSYYEGYDLSVNEEQDQINREKITAMVYKYKKEQRVKRLRFRIVVRLAVAASLLIGLCLSSLYFSYSNLLDSELNPKSDLISYGMEEVQWTSICDLIAEPQDYGNDQTLHLRGIVTSSYAIFGLNFYTIQDANNENCEVRILTTGIAPNQSMEVEVEGKLREAYKIGTWRGLVIIES